MLVNVKKNTIYFRFFVILLTFNLIISCKSTSSYQTTKIEGKKIIVRRAEDGEKVVTLDEKERKLNPDDIVIADGNKAVALGGVMGGYNSEIDSNTKDVLIEVAHFNPYNIRKTSKRLTL